MKNLFPKIDKIGLILFLLILYSGAYELNRIDFSIEQNIYWRFYIFLLCGLLTIFRSAWIKFASLALSVLTICSVFDLPVNVSYGVLVHFLYSHGIKFGDLLPLMSLTAVTIYNLYVIVFDCFIERKKKINLK